MPAPAEHSLDDAGDNTSRNKADASRRVPGVNRMRAWKRDAMKLRIIVAIALLAGGCASREPLSWRRPAGAVEQRSGDAGRCRSLASAVLRRDLGIDADLASTMGHDWRAAGTFSMEKQSLESTSVEYAEWVFDRCMEKKGYAPTDDRPPSAAG